MYENMPDVSEANDLIMQRRVKFLYVFIKSFTYYNSLLFIPFGREMMTFFVSFNDITYRVLRGLNIPTVYPI